MRPYKQKQLLLAYIFIRTVTSITYIMSNYLHHRRLNPRHLSKYIIVSQTLLRPGFMNIVKFRNNSWPTPAMKIYAKVVSESFAQYSWKQDGERRKMLLTSIASELFYEGGG